MFLRPTGTSEEVDVVVLLIAQCYCTIYHELLELVVYVFYERANFPTISKVKVFQNGYLLNITCSVLPNAVVVRPIVGLGQRLRESMDVVRSGFLLLQLIIDEYL